MAEYKHTVDDTTVTLMQLTLKDELENCFYRDCIFLFWSWVASRSWPLFLALTYKLVFPQPLPLESLKYLFMCSFLALIVPKESFLQCVTPDQLGTMVQPLSPNLLQLRMGTSDLSFSLLLWLPLTFLSGIDRSQPSSPHTFFMHTVACTVFYGL